MEIKVLVAIDDTVNLYYVEGQNVNYATCNYPTIDEALDGFLYGLELSHRGHIEHDFKVTNLFKENPYKLLNKFDDGVKEYSLTYRGL